VIYSSLAFFSYVVGTRVVAHRTRQVFHRPSELSSKAD